MADQLIIRADGHHQLGYGHIMRTLAVAEEALVAALRVPYVGHIDEGARAELRRRSIPHQDLSDRWTDAIDDHSLVLVDATVDDVDLTTAHTRAAALAIVDDDPTSDRPADFVVAPDLEGSPDGLSMPVLTGWEHALIRSEFRTAPATGAGSSGEKTLIALFGGTDPTGAGSQLINRLETQGHLGPFSSLTLIEGPGSADRLENRTIGGSELVVVRHPHDLVERMHSASAAITASGTTMLELAALAVPMAVVAVVPEQEKACARMQAAGALAVDLGVDQGSTSIGAVLNRLGDAAEAAAIAAAVHERVDGMGAQRVLARLTSTARGCR